MQFYLWQKYVLLVLVYHFGDQHLPGNSVSRFIDQVDLKRTRGMGTIMGFVLESSVTLNQNKTAQLKSKPTKLKFADGSVLKMVDPWLLDKLPDGGFEPNFVAGSWMGYHKVQQFYIIF